MQKVLSLRIRMRRESTLSTPRASEPALVGVSFVVVLYEIIFSRKRQNIRALKEDYFRKRFCILLHVTYLPSTA